MLIAHTAALLYTTGMHHEDVHVCRGCSCGHLHEWQASVTQRTLQGQGCPVCQGRRPCACNSLAVRYAAIAAQWHPTLNAGLRPQDMLPLSNKKAWWQCELHGAWQAVIRDRTYGEQGCPVCAKTARLVNRRRRGTLQQEHPELAGEWHPTRNGSLTPHSITCSSTRPVWWLCPRSTCQHPHEWAASVSNRANRGSSCPFCSGRRVCPCNSLAALHPEVAAWWHPTRNHPLMPEHCTPKSCKQVWWTHRAAKLQVHEWLASINNRVAKSSACPLCRGRR